MLLFGQIITFWLIIKVTILLFFLYTSFCYIANTAEKPGPDIFLLNKGKVDVLSDGVKLTLMSHQKYHTDVKTTFLLCKI